jgi:alkylation response protein AidB-like acyl-CoA dehydrogenase
MEEAGRALLPAPLFSTVALAGATIDGCGDPEQKRKYLSAICRGDARATLAFVEPGAGWDGADVQMTLSNGRLSGEKLFVPDAGAADFIVVVARDGTYVVDAKDPGVSITPMAGMDLTRRLYTVALSDATAEKLSTTAGLDRGLSVATTALAAEMVGGMQRTLDITVDYAKTRKQFGKAIGSFQAVQHQCADMLVWTESSRSAAYGAAWALTEGVADAKSAVSVAKVYASDACREVGNRGVQVQGGNFLVPVGARMRAEFEVKRQCLQVEQVLDARPIVSVEVRRACEVAEIVRVRPNLGVERVRAAVGDPTVRQWERVRDELGSGCRR